MAKKGFTIIEIIISIAILVIALSVLLGTFTLDLRHATQTREALLARLVLESLAEEVQAHQYGSPKPARWDGEVKSFPTVVEGRKVINQFSTRVTLDPKLGNGSVFGQSQESLDVLLLEVKWTEATSAGASSQEKSLTVNLSVAKSL